MIREDEKRVDRSNWEEKKERRRELRNRIQELTEELETIKGQLHAVKGINRSKAFLEKEHARVLADRDRFQVELNSLFGGRAEGSPKVERTPEEMEILREYERKFDPQVKKPSPPPKKKPRRKDDWVRVWRGGRADGNS